MSLFGKAPPLGPVPPWAADPLGRSPQAQGNQQMTAQQVQSAAQQMAQQVGLGGLQGSQYMGTPIDKISDPSILQKVMDAITAIPSRYPSSIGQVSMPDPHAITSAVQEMQMDMRQMRQSMTVMHDALAHLSEHQSLLLSYITYLRPEGEPLPEDPVSFPEWCRVQAVTAKINKAIGA